MLQVLYLYPKVLDSFPGREKFPFKYAARRVLTFSKVQTYEDNLILVLEFKVFLALLVCLNRGEIFSHVSKRQIDGKLEVICALQGSWMKKFHLSSVITFCSIV